MIAFYYLQELVVPIIESARRREEISKKVNVKLLTSQPKIVSNILKVELLQENNVSRYEKGRKIKAGIYNGYDLVSNDPELILDSASGLASERLFTLTLTVTKAGVSGSILTLKLFDAEDMYNPLIEKTVINNTLIQTDF